ncbi:hypothetical protein ACFXDH_06740 [Streptomyces sp. NPDC059467]|uniref:hypothetical protein n=1 Tax=Streptomyces sp. NPDC059467 TaxID=3346844 RepID=UPI0036A70738
MAERFGVGCGFVGGIGWSGCCCWTAVWTRRAVCSTNCRAARPAAMALLRGRGKAARQWAEAALRHSSTAPAVRMLRCAVTAPDHTEPIDAAHCHTARARAFLATVRGRSAEAVAELRPLPACDRDHVADLPGLLGRSCGDVGVRAPDGLTP